jgi:hypothetical protein
MYVSEVLNRNCSLPRPSHSLLHSHCAIWYLSILLFSQWLSLVFIFRVGRLHFAVLALAKRLARSAPTHLKRLSHQFDEPSKGKVDQPPVPLTKPFLDSTFQMLAKASFLSGVVCILATRKGYWHASTVQTIFHFLSTVTAYVWAFSCLLPSQSLYIHLLYVLP